MTKLTTKENEVRKLASKEFCESIGYKYGEIVIHDLSAINRKVRRVAK